MQRLKSEEDESEGLTSSPEQLKGVEIDELNPKKITRLTPVLFSPIFVRGISTSP